MVDEFRVRWHGHASFTVGKTKKILIDPFITGNPSAKVSKDELKADIVVVTHAHSDHLGDAVDIARKNNAPIVTMVELAWMLQEENDDIEFHGINYGGGVEIDGVTFKSVFAIHSSTYNGKYAGPPMGVVIEDDLTLYHAGDTGLFGDMSLIKEMYRPEISLLPIGGYFTMGIPEALYASRLLGSRYIIPMHYNTFDLIHTDPQEFKRKLEGNGQMAIVLGVEEEVKFDSTGRKLQ